MSLDIDKKLKYKVADFLDEFRKKIKKNAIQEYDSLMFDADSRDILAMLLSEAYKNQAETHCNYLYVQAALRTLERKLGGVPKKLAIQRRLKLFARAWFLSVDASAKVQTENGLWINATQIIYFNNAFNVLFQPHQTRFTNKFLNQCLGLFESRMKDDQGLGMTCAYGKPETDENRINILDFGEHFIEETDAKAAEISSKREETKKWRTYNDAFVQCSANLWVAGRSRQGFGNDAPIWNAQGSSLSPSARKQRQELTKTFESVGGYVAALSWYIYVLGKPEQDKNGKLVFDLSIPHRQFKGEDIKPQGFAKHINAIIGDSDFKYMSMDAWEESKSKLLEFYGEELLEVGPRDGMAYSAKLGYLFGETKIQTNKQSLKTGEVKS